MKSNEAITRAKIRFPGVWIRRTLSLSVNVLLSSVTTFCPHFLFTENSFDFWYDSGKTFAKYAKSFDSFAILSSPVAVARSLFRSFSLTESLGQAILSSRNDPFRNICSLHSLSFWVDLPRTVCGSVCLSVEKITPFIKIFDLSAIDFDIVEWRLSFYEGSAVFPIARDWVLWRNAG